MAKDAEKARNGRLVFENLGAGRDVPRLTIHAQDAGGNVIGSMPVKEDGSFAVNTSLVDKSVNILIGPAEAGPEERGRFFALGSAEFRKMLAAAKPEVAIAESIWNKWYLHWRCVSGTVRRCFPYPYVLDDILVTRNLAKVALVQKTVDYRAIARYPFLKCSPICFGTVEVYRRTCCCHPPILIDPDDLPIEVVPDIPIPPEEVGLVGPIGPGPGPDPAPFALQDLVLTAGAIDEAKVATLQARSLEQRSALTLRKEFVLGKRLFWCHCGPPQKVGEGFVQDGGAFGVCWAESLTFHLADCHEEFAYVVKQPVGGVLVTIYNGVAAHQWFSASDHPTLTSYSTKAVGCKEDTDVPGAGPFVALEDIGSTPSYLLASPPQTSFASTTPPGYNSGLLHPVADPAAAVGTLLNRNLGGSVALQYHFTESMHGLDARFFRISVAGANPLGHPDGAWTALSPITWSTWKLATAEPGSVPLGPHSAGGQSGLSKIPYDNFTDPLPANEEWQDGQYHGVIDTTGLTPGRYLVMIEVFDSAGTRLKPAAAPAGEAGTVAGFTFRRWNVPASTDAVPFAALTHMMWWDNRRAEADIVDIELNGNPSAAECQFLEGGPAATVQIGYRAYHPQPGTPSFLHNHSLTLTRGLNGPSWQVANPPGEEVGEGGPPHNSVSKTLGELLGPVGPHWPDAHDKCAFAVNLVARVKTTNGSGTLSYLDDHEAAAFAAEVV
ncbi:MAG: hypothetical protein ACRDJO_05245 [Actinomycetota bacterium]